MIWMWNVYSSSIWFAQRRGKITSHGHLTSTLSCWALKDNFLEDKIWNPSCLKIKPDSVPSYIYIYMNMGPAGKDVGELSDPGTFNLKSCSGNQFQLLTYRSMWWLLLNWRCMEKNYHILQKTNFLDSSAILVPYFEPLHI